MALTANQKNELVCQLEVAFEDAQAGSGVTASLDEIETAIAALRTAYDLDPDTVTAANLVAAKAMVEGCSFGSLSSSAGEWQAAAAEAV